MKHRIPLAELQVSRERRRLMVTMKTYRKSDESKG
jgi:hypothetical protein